MSSLANVDDPESFQGFTTHDLITGLHGVCVAIDSLALHQEFDDPETALMELAMAAKVLSSILNKEAHS